jgi:hypothetical protein
MNRHDKRASDSVARRTGAVSPTLLQNQLVRVEQERQAYQDLLWAIVRSQGRVRVAKADMHGKQGERLDVREVGDEFYLTIVESVMLVEGGVTDGKANRGEPEGAA